MRKVRYLNSTTCFLFLFNGRQSKRNCDILEEAIHRTLQYVCYEGNGVYLPLTLKMEPPFVPSTIHLSIPSVSKLKQYKIHPSSCSLPYQSHIVSL
jgi:hypothetical protein